MAERPNFLLDARAPVEELSLSFPLHDLRLWAAITEGKKLEVRRALASGAHVNRYNESFSGHAATPLISAVMSGNYDIIQVLLTKGADVNFADKYKFTALSWAVRQGRLNVVKLLLEHGANVFVQDDDGMTLLHVAAHFGGKKVVECLIDKGVDVNQTDDLGNAPIHLATRRLDYDMAFILIRHGAELAMLDEDGQSALHVASEMDSMKLAKLFLTKGADVNQKNGYARTPIECAMDFKSHEVVQYLAEKGADLKNALNAATDKKIVYTLLKIKARGAKNLLIQAVLSNSVKAVELLIKNGERVNDADSRGWTPLHHAAASTSPEELPEILKVLVDNQADINRANKDGLTPLHIAVIYDRDLILIAEFLDQDADINAVDKNGRTALHYGALLAKGILFCSLLINRGADLNPRDVYGWTPLHVASVMMETDISFIEFLASHRTVDVNAKTNSGLTPVALCVINGEYQNLIALIGYDVNVDTVEENSIGPVTFAHLFGRDDMVEVLLDHSSSDHVEGMGMGSFVIPREITRSLRAVNLQTPVLYESLEQLYTILQTLTVPPKPSFSLNFTRIKDLIQKNSREGRSEIQLMEASKLGNEMGFDTIVQLIEDGVDVNCKDSQGKTPLHHAAERGNMEAVLRLYRASNLDLDSQDVKGRTALHLAIVSKAPRSDSVMPLLLNFKANISAADRQGRTPLHYAVWKTNLPKQQFLHNFDTPVNIRDENGWTPLHVATHAGNTEAVKLLVEHGADCNIQTSECYTPLLLASYDGRVEIVKFLLPHCSKADVCQSDGYGPLHFVALAGDSGHYDVAVELLRFGANPHLMSKKTQEYPLDLARSNSMFDSSYDRRIISLLESRGIPKAAKEPKGGFQTAMDTASNFLFEMRVSFESIFDENLGQNSQAPKTAKTKLVQKPAKTEQEAKILKGKVSAKDQKNEEVRLKNSKKTEKGEPSKGGTEKSLAKKVSTNEVKESEAKEAKSKSTKRISNKPAHVRIPGLWLRALNERYNRK